MDRKLGGLGSRLLGGVLAFLGWALGVLMIGVAGLFALAYLGTTDTYYKCPGVMNKQGQPSTSSNVYLKTKTHTPLMFWAKDSGMVWIESYPDGDFLLLQDMRRGSDLLLSFYSDEISADLSMNSGILRARLSGNRDFYGECLRVDR